MVWTIDSWVPRIIYDLQELLNSTCRPHCTLEKPQSLILKVSFAAKEVFQKLTYENMMVSSKESGVLASDAPGLDKSTVFYSSRKPLRIGGTMHFPNTPMNEKTVIKVCHRLYDSLLPRRRYWAPTCSMKWTIIHARRINWQSKFQIEVFSNTTTLPSDEVVRDDDHSEFGVKQIVGLE